MRPVDIHIKDQLTQHLDEIERSLDADVVAIISPIVPGLEQGLRYAVDMLDCKKSSVAVILDTPGGVVEVVERMVTTLRSVYSEVVVIVPDRAMSAGTILALSADRIMMDHLSCLGPIDPQIEKDGKLVPALSYLNQYERLNKKAQEGELTTAEYALLNKTGSRRIVSIRTGQRIVSKPSYQMAFSVQVQELYENRNESKIGDGKHESAACHTHR